jgi:hypothetical protein
METFTKQILSAPKMHFSSTNFCQVNGLKYFKDLAEPRGLDFLAETKTNTT